MFTCTSKHTIIVLPQESLLPEINSLMKTAETFAKQVILLNVGKFFEESVVMEHFPSFLWWKHQNRLFHPYFRRVPSFLVT